MYQVQMEVSGTDGVEEERVLNGIESLRNVNGDSSGTERRFGSVEARRDARHSRKKSSRG